MLASELLRCEVRSESGEKLGSVFDVRVARNPRSSTKTDDQRWRIIGLNVGIRGALERFGLSRSNRSARRHEHAVIPWEQVRRLEGSVIVVSDDAGR